MRIYLMSVSPEGESRVSRVYIAIAVLVIVVIIITVLFSANQLNHAFIDDKALLVNDWSEDITERFYEERLLGLEKQASFTYESDDIYSAFVTVTSIKTLFLMSEDELLSKTIETINLEADNLNITLDNTSEISGQRVLNNSHRTLYVIYNGTDNSKNPSEQIKIIGETWNCGRSGTSIICIGLAQTSDNLNNNPVENLSNWADIIKDKDGTFVEKYGSNIFQGPKGLIFSVKCH
jgi:hypothetical protein